MGKRKNVAEVKEKSDNERSSKQLKLENIPGSAPAFQPFGNVVQNFKWQEWQKWGPYLSERQWGTVREDTSKDGNCWESFTHDEAVYRTYQYGEDGLFGFSDDQAQLCLSLALWNGKDDILKERLYGMTGPQGNHGEDVKECYYYLDATPNHTYMKSLYKYPIQAFPYEEILTENTNRTVQDREFEMLDTGVLNSSEYFDVYAEYCKNSPRDILCQYTVYNRSNQIADIHIIPQIWFRNTWSSGNSDRPKIQTLADNAVLCIHEKLGKYIFEFELDKGQVEKLFTENETNTTLASGDDASTASPKQSSSLQAGFKDSFHRYIIDGHIPALNAVSRGTKFGAHYMFHIPAQDTVVLRCRLVHEPEAEPLDFKQEFDAVMNRAITEYNQFYKKVLPSNLSSSEAAICLQAYAGLCWNKQFFGYDLDRWNAAGQRNINQHWRHMVNNDVISMPDKWEFPWYATWDLAFHMIPFTDIDSEFVKDQLLLFLNQRYIHPMGQLPAYEFDFSDVNPPVHAMACLHVYRKGGRDQTFLTKCFLKLMLNFNWWMNNKQIENSYLFGGGFLGMDNVSCLHRSKLPPNSQLYQVDGSCWMAYYSLCMMQIAVELSLHNESYIDMVVMYVNYFLSIAYAVNFGLDGNGLWDEEDEFYYDILKVTTFEPASKLLKKKSSKTESQAATMAAKSELQKMKCRAMIGLSAIFPVCTLEAEVFEKLPELQAKMKDLFSSRQEVVNKLELFWDGERSMFLSAIPRQRLTALLHYLGHNDEFLSPYGVRALSRYHLDHPFSTEVGGEIHTVHYNSGESCSDMFGGNSNWRGPIWFPMNYLLIVSLEELSRHYKADLRVRFPTTSNRHLDLADIADNLCRRLVSIFLPDNRGHRPCHGQESLYCNDPHFKDLILFYEYFDGDSGRGCGASHQTGWTALVVTLLRKIKGLP